jgi:hypothetical protein
LIACSAQATLSSEPSIVGRWKGQLIFTFSQDGKLIMEHENGGKASGEYKITDTNHLWTNITDTGTLFKATGEKDNIMEYEFIISGETLTLSWKEGVATVSMKLVRAKD